MRHRTGPASAPCPSARCASWSPPRPILPESSVACQKSSREAHARQIVSGNRHALPWGGESMRSSAAELRPVAVEDAVRTMVGGAVGSLVVGEERGGEPPADGAPYWLVDPICGTRNFASGVPLYSINLALVEGGQVTAAVVGDPSTDEIQVAERGRGAWAVKDGARRRLRTSEESRTIVVEDGKSSGARRERAAQFTAAVIRADRWHFRSLGSTLALSYVGAGRVSAYVLFWASAVHTAAGTLLATEAGGTLSDIDGRPWTVDSDSVIVSATADLHQELLDLARSASKLPR